MTTKEIRELCDTLDMNDTTPDKNQNHLCILIGREEVIKDITNTIDKTPDESFTDEVIGSIEAIEIMYDNSDVIKDIEWDLDNPDEAEDEE